MKELFTVCRELIARDAMHIKKRVRMGDVKASTILEHAHEELAEIEQAITALAGRDAIRSEIADLFGVLVHLCCRFEIFPDEIVTQCLAKWLERFDGGDS